MGGWVGMEEEQKEKKGGGGRALLGRRGEGGRGSRVGGEVVQGGEPPFRNEPYRPRIAKKHHIDPFSTYICHNV